MSPVAPTKSLLSKIILWTSLGGLFIALVLVGPTIAYTQEKEREEHRDRAVRAVAILGEFIVEKLEHGEPAIPPQGSGTIQFYLYDREGRFLEVEGRETPPCLLRLDTELCQSLGHTHIMEKLTDNDQRLLGTLVAHSEAEPVLISLVNRLVGPFAFVLLFLLMNGILTIWVFYRLILTPISVWIQADRRGLSGNEANVIIPETEIPDDELGSIMKSRNTLLRRLREYQKFIQEKNAVLQAQRAELMRWSRELEQRIDDKKRELREAQEQLVQNEKLASLGQLAAGIAHEINNPLATIAGYSEDLREQVSHAGLDSTEAGEDLRHGLQVIEDQVFRCKKIVRKLLDFARKSSFDIDTVDMQELVLQTIPLVEHRRSAKGCQVHAALSQVPAIRTCQDSLQQVLVNLLENAIDAAPRDGQVVVSVKPAGDHAVELAIADDGAGIPREIQNRVFDPFFTTKAVGAGTGLGLSICYGIVNDLKGHLTFDTVVGRGTTFRVRIPDYDAPAPPDPVHADSQETTITLRPRALAQSVAAEKPR